MDEIFNLFKQKDKRQKLEKYKINKYFFDKYLQTVLKIFKDEEVIELWNVNVPSDSLAYVYILNKLNKQSQYILSFFTANIDAKNNLNFTFNYNSYYYFILLLKLQFNNLFFPVDMTYYLKTNSRAVLVGITSYFTNNYLKLMFQLDEQFINLTSISNIYSSFTWVERELSESNDITFLNLKDSRRLLSDYTLLKTNLNDYNTTSYNILTQDIYLIKKLLHWLYVFSFFLNCALLSFIFYNKNLISLLLISEVILLLLFFLIIIVASFYNINYLLSFSFFILIFGGLELALNLLLLIL